MQRHPEEDPLYPGWYKIPGLDNYMANACGNIYTKFYEKVLNPVTTADGYLQVSVTAAPYDSRSVLVHRLVASAFYGYDEREVNHKDGNKQNNHYTNLEYCTHKANMEHASKSGLMTHSRPVIIWDLVEGTTNYYPTIVEAANSHELLNFAGIQNTLSEQPFGSPFKGRFVMKYEEDSRPFPTMEVINTLMKGRKRPILVTEKKTGLTQTIESIRSVGEIIGKAPSGIHARLKRSDKIDYGSHFVEYLY